MCALTVLLSVLSAQGQAQQPTQQNWLENMTWPEVHKRVGAGTVSVIIPTGGTEQNGWHLTLGKHNVIARHAAEKVAQDAGNTLIAPVMAYVPQGRITPPEGHMRFAGTISLTDETFYAVLDQTARSLKQHGFKYIFLMGESGGNQTIQENLAEELSDEWEDEGVKVVSLNSYYHNQQVQVLITKGFNVQEIGEHAGMRETSELLFLCPDTCVRKSLLRDYQDFNSYGATGNSTLATRDLGEELFNLKVAAAVAQIKGVRGEQ